MDTLTARLDALDGQLFEAYRLLEALAARFGVALPAGEPPNVGEITNGGPPIPGRLSSIEHHARRVHDLTALIQAEVG